MMAPFGMRCVASVTDTAHGMPSSRLTMMAWLSAAPTSTTTPAAGTNSGVQAGSVIGATRMSPYSSAEESDGSSTTQARPLTLPGQPGTPWIASPTAIACVTWSRFFGHVVFAGAGPLMMNGGSSVRSQSWCALRAATVARISDRSPAARAWSSSSNNRHTSTGESTRPAATARRPSSRNAIRDSWITRMMFVFDRSRPGTNTDVLATAAWNWPSTSAFPARTSAIASVSCVRSRSRSSWRTPGPWSEDIWRMWSIRPRARSGSVSHVSAITSHSFGPREPNSARNVSRSETNDATEGSPDPRNRVFRPTGPPSNIAPTAGDRAALRPRSHIA